MGNALSEQTNRGGASEEERESGKGEARRKTRLDSPTDKLVRIASRPAYQ